MQTQVHPLRRALIAYLKVNKAVIQVPSKYADFADIFSWKLVVELPENEISNHAIKQVDDQQPPYGLIYSLGLMGLEILKPYIENNLANGFVRPTKSPSKATIFFDKIPNSCLRLYVDDRGLNNLTIKNQYL